MRLPLRKKLPFSLLASPMDEIGIKTF